MSAIPASSVSMKTMADGTLRISFDVEPSQAQDAFKLFAAPGTQVAIAALKDGSFLAQPVDGYPEYTQGIPDKYPEVTPNIPQTYQDLPPPRVQLGDACYWTVMRCNDPYFWEFLNDRVFENNANVPFSDSVATAAEAVKAICYITSRKELDTNPEANRIWNREIRQPYSEYLKRMEAV